MHIFYLYLIFIFFFLLLKIIQDPKGGNSMGSTAKEDNIQSITTFRIINIQTHNLALSTRGEQINERYTIETRVSARKIIIQYLEIFRCSSNFY